MFLYSIGNLSFERFSDVGKEYRLYIKSHEVRESFWQEG